jgi:hypothetical protein
MAGILEWANDPANMGLLNLSAGLLQASGPSRTPIGVGQALGMGVQQGMQGFQQAQQNQMQQQMFGARLDAARRQQEMEASRSAAMARLAQDPRFAGMGDLLQVAPNAAIEQALQRPQEPKAPTTRKLREGNEEVTQEFVGGQWREVARGPAFSDKPLVTIGGEQQESAFQKRVGQEMGDQYANLLKADMNAPAAIGKYERLGSLLGQVNTGKFKGATTDIKAAAKGLGIDLTAVGVADDVAPAQAARALANQIALELRNPAGGAGMPGAMSDKDREFLIQSIPGLENDPSAIGKMIEYRVKLARREQEVAKKARAYRKKNGRFDEGFYDELQEWSSKNPLFPQAEVKPVPKPAAGEFSIRRLP